MKLKDARDNYNYFSQKTSDIVRQLGFAGIALIWIFKAETIDQQIIPNQLILPSTLIVFGLTLDLLHYVAGTLSWGIYHRHKEKSKITEKAEFLAPRQINWASLIFFWLKIISIGLAYIYLLCFLKSQLF